MILSISKEDAMSARHKKVRKASVAVTNRSVAVVLSLGVALGTGVADAATASAVSQTGARGLVESRWNPGQTNIPILKNIISGTTFLDWAHPGLTQNMHLANKMGQTIFAVPRTRVGWVIADMAASAGGLFESGLQSAGSPTKAEQIKKGIEHIAAFAAAASRIKQNLTERPNDPQVAFEATALLNERLRNLSLDVQTVIGNAIDLIKRSGSALNELPPAGRKLRSELIQRIIRESGAVNIPDGTAGVVKHQSQQDTWGNGFWKVPIIGPIGKAIAASTGFAPAALLDYIYFPGAGPSGTAGMAGVDTAGMFVMTKDGTKTAYMTSAPDISWIAEPDRIVPSVHGGSLWKADESLGHYSWDDRSPHDRESVVQDAMLMLEKNGIDSDKAVRVLKAFMNETPISREERDKLWTAANDIRKSPTFGKVMWLISRPDYKADHTLEEGIKTLIHRAPSSSLEQASAKFLNGSHSREVHDLGSLHGALKVMYAYGIPFSEGERYVDEISALWSMSKATTSKVISGGSNYSDWVALMRYSSNGVEGTLKKFRESRIAYNAKTSFVDFVEIFQRSTEKREISQRPTAMKEESERAANADRAQNLNHDDQEGRKRLDAIEEHNFKASPDPNREEAAGATQDAEDSRLYEERRRRSEDVRDEARR
ncbi:hypothetical protein [Streptomyces sp. NPDC007205]|uniref:hypothetical protein n=1 Tax=Streptomyces sp. NPDC007205 TaxID=3154316 RepID=UPI00340EADC7